MRPGLVVKNCLASPQYAIPAFVRKVASRNLSILHASAMVGFEEHQISDRSRNFRESFTNERRLPSSPDRHRRQHHVE